jgi:hypothetical protein
VVAGVPELSDKIVGPLRRMAEHRCLFPRLEPSFEAAGSVWRPVPGDPLTSPGPDLWSRIRVLVPAAPLGLAVATRRAGCWEVAVGAGMGGRGLSHLQELPLIIAGSRRVLAKTGACGQPRSRTANRMAVPFH